MVIELEDVEDALERLTEEGLLIKETVDGEPKYRAIRAVCILCNKRIQNALECMRSMYPRGEKQPSIDLYKCPNCDRIGLCVEGNKDFEQVWEYAHG